MFITGISDPEKRAHMYRLEERAFMRTLTPEDFREIESIAQKNRLSTEPELEPIEELTLRQVMHITGADEREKECEARRAAMAAHHAKWQTSDFEQEIFTWRTRAEQAESRIRTLEATLASVRAELATLQRQRGAAPPPPPPPNSTDTKFKRAKNAFSRRYHPNNTNLAGLERLVRAEIFKEFWEDLEQIEKS